MSRRYLRTFPQRSRSAAILAVVLSGAAMTFANIEGLEISGLRSYFRNHLLAWGTLGKKFDKGSMDKMALEADFGRRG
jgi:hypothetical protein